MKGKIVLRAFKDLRSGDTIQGMEDDMDLGVVTSPPQPLYAVHEVAEKVFGSPVCKGLDARHYRDQLHVIAVKWGEGEGKEVLLAAQKHTMITVISREE